MPPQLIVIMPILDKVDVFSVQLKLICPLLDPLFGFKIIQLELLNATQLLLLLNTLNVSSPPEDDILNVS